MIDSAPLDKCVQNFQGLSGQLLGLFAFQALHIAVTAGYAWQWLCTASEWRPVNGISPAIHHQRPQIGAIEQESGDPLPSCTGWPLRHTSGITRASCRRIRNRQPFAGPIHTQQLHAQGSRPAISPAPKTAAPSAARAGANARHLRCKLYQCWGQTTAGASPQG